MSAMVQPLTPQAGRVPASDLDAEAAVISAIVLDPRCVDEVRDAVAAEDFYADANRRVFQAITDLCDQGTAPDIVTIANRLRDQGRFDQVGGSPYLFQLINATPSVANVLPHAALVRSKARVRAMTAACQRIAAEGYGAIADVKDWLSQAEQAVFEVAESKEVAGMAVESAAVLIPRVARELLEHVRDRGARGPTGVRALTPVLTEYLNGYFRGKPYILAARPGMGKSAFALQQCIEVARSGELAVFVSAEMTKEDLAKRAISQIAKVDSTRMRTGKLLRDEYDRLIAAAQELRDLPLAFTMRSGGTTTQIRGDVRRAHAEHRKRFGDGLKLGMVVVDYIQVLNGHRERGESREAEVGRLSKELMWLALESNAVVIVISQLNREVDKRPEKRPVLTDLRDSGSLEQDAFGVLFLYRDDYYKKDSSDRGICEVIIAKMREGQTGKVMLKWTPEYLRFDDLAPEYQYREETADLFSNFGDPPSDYESDWRNR